MSEEKSKFQTIGCRGQSCRYVEGEANMKMLPNLEKNYWKD